VRSRYAAEFPALKGLSACTQFWAQVFEETMSHRYSKLGYIALNVSNIERSIQFYEGIFGLQANGEGADGARFLRCSKDHHNVVLFQGAPGLKRIGWQLESERELQVLAATLNKNGLAIQEVDADERNSLRQGPTIRFTDPFTGATHEYYSKMAEADDDWHPTVAKIQRLGHVVLKAPRYEEALRFYQDVLNFRISDRIGERATFMRCFPSPFHHSLGLNNGTDGAFHHVNFMVSEIDDIGKAMWRLKNNNVPIMWGPGRHPPSGSVFLYFLDPDGLTVEYSFGMEEFPEQGARDYRVLPPVLSESGDFWGAPPMDERYGRVGEIEVDSQQGQEN
jgi:2,3-dihydroxy-p-cumate/2,3-dihydroxybenzoate 3,4-dioxygenase